MYMKNPEILQKAQAKRVFQNKKVHLDDNNVRVPPNVVIYKDLHLYRELYKGMYFGGRSLLADYR